jgi:hypothetical protein
VAPVNCRHLFASGAVVSACALVSVAAGAAAFAPAVAAGGGATVTVRVEGASKTLLAAKTVTPQAGSITKGGAPKGKCSSKSAMGALQLATHGSWGGSWEAKYSAYLVTKILGVTATSASKTYWEIFVNNKASSLGACLVKPRTGQQLLFAQVPYTPYEYPLVLHAPSTAKAGSPLTVTVMGVGKSGKAAPVAGATVKLGAATAKTGSAGTAQLTPATAGTFTLSASATKWIRDEVTVSVS